MATHDVVADIMLEDKIADLWPDYPCLYDVKSPDFKNIEFNNGSQSTFTFMISNENGLRHHLPPLIYNK